MQHSNAVWLGVEGTGDYLWSSLCFFFWKCNRSTVRVQRYAWWDCDCGVFVLDTVSITGHGGNWRRCVSAIQERGVQSRVKHPPSTHTHTHTCARECARAELQLFKLTRTHSPAGNPQHCMVDCSQEALMKLLMIFMCAVACKQGLGRHLPAGRSVSTFGSHWLIKRRWKGKLNWVEQSGLWINVWHDNIIKAFDNSGN